MLTIDTIEKVVLKLARLNLVLQGKRIKSVCRLLLFRLEYTFTFQMNYVQE